MSFSANGLQIVELTDANISIVYDLVEDADQNGHASVRRTIDEWNSGLNKFSDPGENLWALFSENDLIGIVGLNHDPYTDQPNIGRVRHFYIHQAHRRKGYGTLLMNMIVNKAHHHFTTLRLFTANPNAAIFYENFGFRSVSGNKVTHILVL